MVEHHPYSLSSQAGVSTDSMLLSAFPLSDLAAPSSPLLPGLSLKSVQSSELSWRSQGRTGGLQVDRFSGFRMLEAIQDCDFLAKDCTSRRLGGDQDNLAREARRGDPRQVQHPLSCLPPSSLGQSEQADRQVFRGVGRGRSKRPETEEE